MLAKPSTPRRTDDAASKRNDPPISTDESKAASAKTPSERKRPGKRSDAAPISQLIKSKAPSQARISPRYKPLWVSRQTYDDLSMSICMFQALLAKGHVVPFGARSDVLPDVTFIPMPPPKRKKTSHKASSSSKTPSDTGQGQAQMVGQLRNRKRAVLRRPAYSPAEANARIGCVHNWSRAFERVKLWFDQFMECFYDERAFARPLLVLTGPSGAGKTFLTRWAAAAQHVRIQMFDPMDFGAGDGAAAAAAKSVETWLRNTMLTNGRQGPTLLLIQDVALCPRSLGEVLAQLARRASLLARTCAIVLEVLPVEAFARRGSFKSETGHSGGNSSLSLFAQLSRQSYCEWVAVRAPPATVCRRYARDLRDRWAVDTSLGLRVSSALIERVVLEARSDMRQVELLLGWLLVSATPASSFKSSGQTDAAPRTDLDVALRLVEVIRSSASVDLLLQEEPERIVAQLGRDGALRQIVGLFQSWFNDSLGVVADPSFMVANHDSESIDAGCGSASPRDLFVLLMTELRRSDRTESLTMLPASLVQFAFGSSRAIALDTNSFVRDIQRSMVQQIADRAHDAADDRPAKRLKPLTPPSSQSSTPARLSPSSNIRGSDDGSTAAAFVSGGVDGGERRRLRAGGRKRKSQVTTDASGFVRVTYIWEEEIKAPEVIDAARQEANDAANELAALAHLRDADEAVADGPAALRSRKAWRPDQSGRSRNAAMRADTVWAAFSARPDMPDVPLMDDVAELADVLSDLDGRPFPQAAEIGLVCATSIARRCASKLQPADLLSRPSWASLAKWIHPITPRSNSFYHERL